MPLIQSASPNAIGQNIRREEAANKPYRQALAIALATQDRNRRAAGGGTPGFDLGGSMSLSQADPWWTRQAARGEEVHPGGLVASSTAGRADHVPTSVAADSYVMPADVVAGMGMGNTLNGARVTQAMLSTGPYGTPLPRMGHRADLPRPPAISGMNSRQTYSGFAEGGHASNVVPFPNREQHPPVKVLLSGGEFVIPPEDWSLDGGRTWFKGTKSIGGGDARRGHKILDKFVVMKRAQQIKELKKLPGPVRS